MSRLISSHTIPAFPSLLSNNLTSSSSDSLLYVRLHEVHIVDLKNRIQKISVKKADIFQASFLEIQDQSVILILTNTGLQMWLDDAETMIFMFPISSIFGSEIDFEHCYFRGSCVMNDRYLSVGTSKGKVLIFNCDSFKDGGDFPLVHNLETELSPIHSISSSERYLICSNDNGKIFGFDSYNSFEQSFAFKGYGFPCVSVALVNDTLIACYSSGHIRVFRTDIFELCIEISAHSRAISALSVSKDKKEFATCGQDQMVQEWSIPDFKSIQSSKIELIGSFVLENKICTGLCFLNDSRICVASYDDDKLSILKK